MYSIYDPDNKGTAGAVTIFAALVVLKIIFVDIWVSLGDAITDFLQGLFLMFDFYDGFTVKDDTWGIGVIVIAACWVPGIVAIVHILAYYRFIDNLKTFLPFNPFLVEMSTLAYQKIWTKTFGRQG